MNSEQNLHQRLINQSESEPVPQVRPTSLNFFAQSWLLIYKNVILTIKNPKNILFLIITPLLLGAFMAGFQQLARQNGSKVLRQPQIRPLPNFPRCIGSDCVTLDYRIMADSSNTQVPPWSNFVVNYIAGKRNLIIGPNRDIVLGSPLTTYVELQNYYNSFKLTPNKTQIGVIFCGQVPPPQIQRNLTYFCNGTKDFTYYLVLNKTDSLTVIFYDLMQPLPIDPVAASLKLLIDNAILNYIQSPQAIWPDQKIKFTTSQFPIGPNRYIQDYDIVTAIGAFYYMITPLFAFLFIQSEIVRQKQYKLRQGLNIFGASHAAYWVSWFVVAILYSLVCAVSTYLSGMLFGFGFFQDTPALIIIFCLFFPFTLAMQMMSFWLSTLSPTLKAANAVSYGIVLFAIVVQSFVSDNNLLLFLFSTDVSSLILFLKTFLLFYPPFSYTKIFTNITAFSGYHFDFSQRRWLRGDIRYTWSVFAQNNKGPLPFGGGQYDRYSDLISMGVMFGDCIFFILLAWYFDILIASNRGRGQSVFFPIRKLYRLFFKKPAQKKTVPLNQDMSSNPNYLLQDEEQSTIKQRNRVFRNAQTGIPALGLRIKCLSKTFKKIFSKNKVQAIKNFNLQIQPNQLMGILGHNGAGKTTLINILTGVISPDQCPQLEIIINNRPIQKINQIRKYIGVCSQFDILWSQLTAYEHLYMFARLKNIPKYLIDQKIDQILGFVNLSKQKYNKVKSFSGGMKRRLSLAISAIGNPKIILLDQPTTGLDPKVRQQVWQLIQKLKIGKSIILTTHSMQQADILADRICVMVKGKLKCVGSSFYLKHKYGQGHRITLNVDNANSKKIMPIIKKLFPMAIQVDNKGGNLIIGMENFEDMLKMVKMLQNTESLGLDEYSLKQSIKDWNVSHSTLEQVFMKVTRQKQE